VTEIDIHLMLQPGTDASEAASEFRAYLEGIDGVTPVEVEAEQPHVGLAEVLAIVQLSSAAIDLVVKLTDFIKSRSDKGKVKGIEIEIDGERIPVGKLTPEQRLMLIAGIVRET
jgi:hypothetical protein